MGSHPTQAVAITIFFLAFTALAGAMAGGGVLMLLVFLVLLGVSIALLLKCKAMEKAAAE